MNYKTISIILVIILILIVGRALTNKGKLWEPYFTAPKITTVPLSGSTYTVLGGSIVRL